MPLVHLTLFEEPVERTAEQIEELRLAGLVREPDAKPPAPSPAPAKAPVPAAPAPANTKE